MEPCAVIETVYDTVLPLQIRSGGALSSNQSELTKTYKNNNHDNKHMAHPAQPP